MRGIMNVPATGSDEVIQVDEGRQQEAWEYTAHVSDERLAWQDDDQCPGEAADRGVGHIVKHRAFRLVLPVL